MAMRTIRLSRWRQRLHPQVEPIHDQWFHRFLRPGQEPPGIRLRFMPLGAFPQHCWSVTNRVNAKGKQLYLFAEKVLLAQTPLKGLHLGGEQGTDIGTTRIDEV